MIPWDWDQFPPRIERSSDPESYREQNRRRRRSPAPRLGKLRRTLTLTQRLHSTAALLRQEAERQAEERRRLARQQNTLRVWTVILVLGALLGFALSAALGRW